MAPAAIQLKMPRLLQINENLLKNPLLTFYMRGSHRTGFGDLSQYPSECKRLSRLQISFHCPLPHVSEHGSPDGMLSIVNRRITAGKSPLYKTTQQPHSVTTKKNFFLIQSILCIIRRQLT